MSTQSIISLPPCLEMTSRSIPLLRKYEHESLRDNDSNKIVSSFSSQSNLHKLTETSFPVMSDNPVNVRIFFHAAKMSSARPRKVMYGTFLSS